MKTAATHKQLTIVIYISIALHVITIIFVLSLSVLGQLKIVTAHATVGSKSSDAFYQFSVHSYNEKYGDQ